MKRDGPENVFTLHDDLAAWLVNNATVKRNNTDLKDTMDKIKEIRERYNRISLADKGNFANQTYAFANQFKYMLELSLIICKGALLRNESRGSHYKEDFPEKGR